jgi:hypothetical protein
VITLPLRAQKNNYQRPGDDLKHYEHSVGFQLLEAKDYSRVVTAGPSSSVALPRPMRIYLWYPALNKDHPQSMCFGRYAKLSDEDTWPAEIVGNLSAKLKFLKWPLAHSQDQILLCQSG